MFGDLFDDRCFGEFPANPYDGTTTTAAQRFVSSVDKGVRAIYVSNI